MTTKTRSTKTKPKPFTLGRGYWRRGDGAEVLIRDMTDTHLQNAMQLLERAARRKLEALAYSADAYSSEHDSMGGEAALDAAREMYDAAETGDFDVAEFYPKYRELERERTRREKARS